MPCLSVATPYQDQPLESARGADRKPRLAPVHPAYARRLPDPSLARTRNQLLHGHRRDCRNLEIKHKGTIVRVYIDERHLWDELCEAVLCLKLDLSRGKVLKTGGHIHEV